MNTGFEIRWKTSVQLYENRHILLGRISLPTYIRENLYDATTLAWTNTALLHTMPPLAVAQRVPPGYMALQGQHFEFIGTHFFDAASTPTFIMDGLTPTRHAFMAKTLGVTAPAGASKGPQGTGAVPWLDLNHKDGYLQGNVSQVYRVETAGGANYPNCTSVGVQIIDYAAEYWFFNNAI